MGGHPGESCRESQVWANREQNGKAGTPNGGREFMIRTLAVPCHVSSRPGNQCRGNKKKKGKTARPGCVRGKETSATGDSGKISLTACVLQKEAGRRRKKGRPVNKRGRGKGRQGKREGQGIPKGTSLLLQRTLGSPQVIGRPPGRPEEDKSNDLPPGLSKQRSVAGYWGSSLHTVPVGKHPYSEGQVVKKSEPVKILETQHGRRRGNSLRAKDVEWYHHFCHHYQENPASLRAQSFYGTNRAVNPKNAGKGETIRGLKRFQLY